MDMKNRALVELKYRVQDAESNEQKALILLEALADDSVAAYLNRTATASTASAYASLAVVDQLRSKP